MSNPYLPQDVLDEAGEAIRQGIPLPVLAGKLYCSPEHLANLLGLPQWREIPADGAAGNMVQEPSVDLWASDRLESRL